MLVDCGGGTADITVHEKSMDEGHNLKDIFKATGGPYGSIGMYILFQIAVVYFIKCWKYGNAA